MGMLSDLFESFRTGGEQVTRRVTAPETYGYTRPTRASGGAEPTVTRVSATVERKVAPVKQAAIKSINDLSRDSRIQFVNKEVNKIGTAIRIQTHKTIPSLHDIQVAGYKYAKQNPRQARLIFNSGSTGVNIVKRAVPKNIGIPIGKAAYAFADGEIHALRDKPLTTLSMVALPTAVRGATRVARKIPAIKSVVNSQKAMKTASGIIGAAYSYNVYERVNAPVFTDKYREVVGSESSKRLPDGSTQITQAIKQIPIMRKPTLAEKAYRLGGIWSTEVGSMALGSVGLPRRYNTKKLEKLLKQPKTTIKKQVRKLKPSEIKKYAKQKKVEIKKAKAAKKLQKKYKRIEKAKRGKKILKVEFTKTGIVKSIKSTTAGKLAKQDKRDQEKAIKNLRKRLQKRDKSKLKSKVATIEFTQTGEIKSFKTKPVKRLLKEEQVRRKRQKKKISKRQKQVERRQKIKRIKKETIVKANQVYNKSVNISRLRKQLNNISKKINKIPDSRARKLGIKKQQLRRKISVIVKETNAMRYIITQYEAGTSRRTVVEGISKLPDIQIVYNRAAILEKRMTNALRFINDTVSTQKLTSRRKLYRSDKEFELAERARQDTAANRFSKYVSNKSKTDIQSPRGASTKQGQVLIQKQKTKQIVDVSKELKKLNKIKSDTKQINDTITQTEPKINTQIRQIKKELSTIPRTRTAMKKKTQVINRSISKLKSNTKELTVLIPRLNEKQRILEIQRQYLINQIKQSTSSTQRNKLRSMINEIQNQRSKSKSLSSSVSKTVTRINNALSEISKQAEKAKLREVSVPKSIIMPKILEKPQLKLMPPLFKPPKPPIKKKKRKVKRGIKEEFVRTPVPTLKQFLG